MDTSTGPTTASMLSGSLIITDAFLGLLTFVLLSRLISHLSSRPQQSRFPLPPGPPQKFIIGNLLDVPTGRSWLGWSKLADLYSSINHNNNEGCDKHHSTVNKSKGKSKLIHLNIFGTHIISVNEPSAARELFEKRSAVFSDRPRVVFGGEMCGWENTLALQRYGERFRRFRREIHQILGTPAAIARFHPLIEIEAQRFLLRCVKDCSGKSSFGFGNKGKSTTTKKVLEHVHAATGAIILRIAYGYRMQNPSEGRRDPLVELTERGIRQISMAAQPGAFLVDVLPFLRYVPKWVPGAGFQHTAEYFKETVTELVEKPFAFVRHQVAAGTAEPSYVSSLLEKYEEGDDEEDTEEKEDEKTGRKGGRRGGKKRMTEEEEECVKWSASSLYTGGADTTVSAIQSFLLAMVLYPRVLRRAREEVDSICCEGSSKTGPSLTRLPTFGDRERMPYVNAIVREVLRWAPIAPMGLPHVNSEEVEFEGTRIPKGSIVMPNIWRFGREEGVYEEPERFWPERFLGGEEAGSERRSASPVEGEGATGKKPERDVKDYVFGFGRRVCPGKELADSSLFLFASMCIAALDIQSPKGSAEVKKQWVEGTITKPEPFEIEVRPRSEAVDRLVRAVEVEHPWTDEDAECIAHLQWKRK